MNILEDGYKEELRRNTEATDTWNNYVEMHRDLRDRLGMLPHELTPEIMVPVGTKAMMRGHMVHTNEILVHMGDGWFVKQSAYQAQQMCTRRIEKAESMINDLVNEKSWIESKREFPQMADIFGGSEIQEIIEEYDETKEKEWTKTHRESVKRQLAIERKERDKKEDEEYWQKLEELELQEEMEKELEQFNEEERRLVEEYLARGEDYEEAKFTSTECESKYIPTDSRLNEEHRKIKSVVFGDVIERKQEISSQSTSVEPIVFGDVTERKEETPSPVTSVEPIVFGDVIERKEETPSPVTSVEPIVFGDIIERKEETPSPVTSVEPIVFGDIIERKEETPSPVTSVEPIVFGDIIERKEETPSPVTSVEPIVFGDIIERKEETPSPVTSVEPIVFGDIIERKETTPSPVTSVEPIVFGDVIERKEETPSPVTSVEPIVFGDIIERKEETPSPVTSVEPIVFGDIIERKEETPSPVTSVEPIVFGDIIERKEETPSPVTSVEPIVFGDIIERKEETPSPVTSVEPIVFGDIIERKETTPSPVTSVEPIVFGDVIERKEETPSPVTSVEPIVFGHVINRKQDKSIPSIVVTNSSHLSIFKRKLTDKTKNSKSENQENIKVKTDMNVTNPVEINHIIKQNQPYEIFDDSLTINSEIEDSNNTTNYNTMDTIYKKINQFADDSEVSDSKLLKKYIHYLSMLETETENVKITDDERLKKRLDLDEIKEDLEDKILLLKDALNIDSGLEENDDLSDTDEDRSSLSETSQIKRRVSFTDRHLVQEVEMEEPPEPLTLFFKHSNFKPPVPETKAQNIYEIQTPYDIYTVFDHCFKRGNKPAKSILKNKDFVHRETHLGDGEHVKETIFGKKQNNNAGFVVGEVSENANSQNKSDASRTGIASKNKPISRFKAMRQGQMQ